MMSPYAYVGCKNFSFQPKSLTQEMKEDLTLNIIDRVSSFYKLNTSDILGSERKYSFMKPRHIAIYLSLKQTGITLTALAKIFNRHHTTIIHSREYIQEQLKFNEEIKEDIKILKYIL